MLSAYSSGCLLLSTYSYWWRRLLDIATSSGHGSTSDRIRQTSSARSVDIPSGRTPAQRSSRTRSSPLPWHTRGPNFFTPPQTKRWVVLGTTMWSANIGRICGLVGQRPRAPVEYPTLNDIVNWDSTDALPIFGTIARGKFYIHIQDGARSSDCNIGPLTTPSD
ncbi:hypothetical protein BOTBODRAFT_399605 [Botryobasidium botryosum FD-172 SS1]|uniref:Uncharacterized protein n=1 Tax=Botryobasidium botryosum (strain FD-172 SS1) TaxID=930990 RepID=A0A067MB47_BOTB1|nr:hypothetical protein BOTBODRAFT_399605 [Botryobasidium botryosum FD-172 SS1]